MNDKKKLLSKLSIFLIALSLSIFYLDNTNEINDFNYEKDNNELHKNVTSNSLNLSTST